MAEAPGSRTQPPRVSGGRPVLKTGRATGPRSLPGRDQPSEREGRSVGVRSAIDQSHEPHEEAAQRNVGPQRTNISVAAPGAFLALTTAGGTAPAKAGMVRSVLALD